MTERELGTIVRPVQSEDSEAAYNSDGMIFAEVCERVYGKTLMPWQKKLLAALWYDCFVCQGRLIVDIPRGNTKQLAYPITAAVMVLDKLKEREDNA